MPKIGVRKAKTNFSQSLDCVLVRLESKTGLRPVGLHQQNLTDGELVFLDEPLPEEIQASFFDVAKFDDFENPRNSK